MAPNRVAAFVSAGRQAHQVTGMVVDDRQRMTAAAPRQGPMPLEVHLPQQVGRLLLEAQARLKRHSRRWPHPPMPHKDRMNRRGRRRIVSRPVKTAGDLACPPSRMSIAYGKNLGFNCRRRPVRTGMRPARPVRKIPITRQPSAKPLVARLRTDPKTPAQLTAVNPLTLRQPNKLSSLIHDRHLLPRHENASP